MRIVERKKTMKEQIKKGEKYISDLKNEIEYHLEEIERKKEEIKESKESIKLLERKLSYSYCSMASLKMSKSN